MSSAGRTTEKPILQECAVSAFYLSQLKEAQPEEQFGASSAVHRYFMAWARAGVFQKMWEAGLEQYDESQGIDWTWLSMRNIRMTTKIIHLSGRLLKPVQQ